MHFSNDISHLVIISHLYVLYVLAVKFALRLIFFTFFIFILFFQNKIETKLLYDFPCSYTILYTFLCLFHDCGRLHSHTYVWILWDKNDFVMWCLQFQSAHEQMNFYAFRFRFIFYENRIYRYILSAVRFVYRFHWLLLLLPFLLSSFSTVDSVTLHRYTATLHQFFHLLRLVIDLCRSISIFIFPQFSEMWKHILSHLVLSHLMSHWNIFRIYLCIRDSRIERQLRALMSKPLKSRAWVGTKKSL